MVLDFPLQPTRPRRPHARAALAGDFDFDDDWEFRRDFRGEIEPSLFAHADAPEWENVRLPHTPRLEPRVTVQQWQGICLYRKFFSLPTDAADKYAALRFEGAMHEARVYLDGQLVAQHAGGYLPFTVSLASCVGTGRTHCVLVWLSNEDNPLIPPGKPVHKLDFHYYGGLYRSVKLVVRDRLRLSDPMAGGGVRIRFEEVGTGAAVLCVDAEIANDHADAHTARIRFTLRDAARRIVGRCESDNVSVAPHACGEVAARIAVHSPRLWSPDDPYLYRLEVEVRHGRRCVDRAVLPVGVRTVGLAPDALLLNGERLWLNGANRHQEYPYIGNALSDAAQWRDAWKIKTAGFNLVRCSHYPPAPAFLDACDTLGLLAIDAIPGWQFFGDEEFQRRALDDVRAMIRRDRHHPSVVLWEASLNETKMSSAFMAEACRAVGEELPARDAFTSGFIDGHFDVFAPARAHDSSRRCWRDDRRERPLFIAEYGDWEYFAGNGDAGFDQPEFKILNPPELSSRQLRGDGEQRLLQQARNFQEALNDIRHTRAIGGAIWVMFDYNRGYWPDIEASGIMDIFRLPKPVFHFYRSQANARANGDGFGGPMVRIANNWTPGSPLTVVVYGNCEEVELRLNGELVGRRQPDRNDISGRLVHPPVTFALERFTPGVLRAVGFIGGEPRAEAVRRTPGEPQRLRVAADLSAQPLHAAENDVIFVYAEIVDAAGTVVPDASHAVRFEVAAGDAVLVGDNPAPAEAGIAAILLRAGATPGAIRITAAAEGLRPGKCRVTSRLPRPRLNLDAAGAERAVASANS